jgi:CheY-like chemotaxis protein
MSRSIQTALHLPPVKAAVKREMGAATSAANPDFGKLVLLGVVSNFDQTPIAQSSIKAQTLGTGSNKVMGTGIPLRKVLIIEDEPSIRNTLYSLLASLGFDGDAAHSAQQALAMVSREQFDAVLLDLRCSDALTEEVVSGIHRIRPSLIGHVLVVTGEVVGAETLELIERHALSRVPRNRLLQDFVGWLRTVFGIAPFPKPIA